MARYFRCFRTSTETADFFLPFWYHARGQTIKTIIDYRERGQRIKTIVGYHENFEHVQSE